MAQPTEKTLLDRIAGSTALLAVSRIGIPLLLAWMVWATRDLIDVERRVAVIEARAEGSARQAQQLQDIVTRMDGRQAATEATMAQMLRSLSRIETVLDQRAPR